MSSFGSQTAFNLVLVIGAAVRYTMIKFRNITEH